MPTFTFSTTEKNKPLLICKGFAYTIDKTTNDKTYWKCEHVRKFKCKGGIHTNCTHTTLLHENDNHNHPGILVQLKFEYLKKKFVIEHLIQAKGLGFKTNYEQDPIFSRHVNQIAALAFLQPNDVSQSFDDLYNPLPQMLHPLLDYFEDTYVGRNRTQGRAKPMFEIELWNMHQRTTDRLMWT
ncbi:unnamed protein product, partial [Rotaria socialis]